MKEEEKNKIIERYYGHVADRMFPCIAAKAALGNEQISVMVSQHMACPQEDEDILKFLYNFIEGFRASTKLYHSAVVIFNNPVQCEEKVFESLLWTRLQAISDLDSLRFPWDSRVARDPSDKNFSFSIGGEALYVIGMHSNSSRVARRFELPAIVFNPHQQFEKLRSTNKYAVMKETVRKRDIKLSGSMNPMLSDFGETSEALQYSGINYDSKWKCPFIARHGNS
jgi:uncharacterized protein